jgi:glucose/mannose transport system substrate-binding protein
MFAALKEAHPDITIEENPNPGGGGVNQRVVLQSRIAAGDYPDTFQTLGGAELKNYVDSGVLQPLDDFYAETGYGDQIPGPLLSAVSVNGSPYVVPLPGRKWLAWASAPRKNGAMPLCSTASI